MAQQKTEALEKFSKINLALSMDPVDFKSLRDLAMSNGGLLQKDTRKRVWPKLMNVDLFCRSKELRAKEEQLMFKENKYYQQVQMDINRCNRRFPPGTRVSRRRILKKQLTAIIMRVLCCHPDLHYYQGFHDIAVTLLLVLGEHMATSLLKQMALYHLRDFLDVNMERTNRLLKCISIIIEAVDCELAAFLKRSEVGHIFALSWLITWFGHDVQDCDVIVRLCDVFLASHPLMPLYVGAALILTTRNDILSLECDMSVVHHSLSKLPLRLRNLDAAEKFIAQAAELFAMYPPAKLRSNAADILRKSSSVKMHGAMVESAACQTPDAILMRRRVQGGIGAGSAACIPSTDSWTYHQDQQEPAAVMTKIAVWTLTLSIGAVSFLVMNASKRWL